MFCQNTAIFFFVNFVFVGIMVGLWMIFKPAGIVINNSTVYFDVSATVLLISAFIAYVISAVIIRIYNNKTAKNELYQLTVYYDGQKCSFFAFADSGNNLREPFSDYPVIVADENLFKDVPCSRVIPVSTVNGEGILKAFKPEKVVISTSRGSGELSRVYIALSKNVKKGSIRESSILNLYQRCNMLQKIKLFLLRIQNRLFKKNCYYINGPETLPPPLTKEEEETVMRELRAGNDTHRELLITHNLRLVVYIAKKFEGCATSTEDLVSIGTIGLMKAVKTFDPQKNIKLATYASRCIENEILMHLRKVSSAKFEMSFDEPLSIDWDGNELTLRDVLGSEPDEISNDIEYNDEKELLLKIILALPEKERDLMKKRFGILGEKEHTQKELADLMGISQSYISRLEKRIILKIKNQIMKEYA